MNEKEKQPQSGSLIKDVVRTRPAFHSSKKCKVELIKLWAVESGCMADPLYIKFFIR
jgi:hypothetical protein